MAFKKMTKPSCDKDTTEILIHYWWNTHFEKQFESPLAVSYKVKHIFTKQTSVHILDIYPRGAKTKFT